MDLYEREEIKMAYIGLAHPVIAALKSQSTIAGVTTPTYGDAFICGKAVSLSVTPNYNESKLYADNILDEYVREFKDGTVSMGVDRLPVKAQSVMFGHTVDESGKEVSYKSGDSGNYVGIGFYVDEMVDGVKQYTASIIYKARFAEGATDYTTKGDSIEFKTPVLEGAIAALDDGNWKKDKVFATESEAIVWIEQQLNYSADGE